MDARVREARASYFPSLANDSSAVHIVKQQHIEIPQGALGVYPQIGTPTGLRACRLLRARPISS